MMYAISSNTAKWTRAASCLLLFSFLLSACGVDSDRFRLEGRLRNMNQGEFWVYSTDGGINGIDTIRVSEGRFAYETKMRTQSTLIVVFPNYSELPVFATPGKAVTIKGDATHLKDVDVKGTDDNEKMTKLRMELGKLMPPEIPAAVERFISDNPASAVSNYLLLHYFLQDRKSDLKKAHQLATQMVKSQPDNVRLQQWEEELKTLGKAQPKATLPAFSATDVKGRRVSADLLSRQVNVVALWATWNYQSTDMLRRLQKLKKKHGDRLAIVGICLDGARRDCMKRLENDSIQWPNVCDGRLWQSPVVQQLALTDVPGNLLIDQRKVILERNLAPQQLEDKIEQLLK